MSIALGLATLGVQCTTNRAVALATLGVICGTQVYVPITTETSLHYVYTSTLSAAIYIAPDTNTVRYDIGYDKFGYNITS